MRFTIEPAAAADVAALAALHTAVADDLTKKHGRGAWSTKTSEKGVLLRCARAGYLWRGRGPKSSARFG